jgi:Zn-dependent protease
MLVLSYTACLLNLFNLIPCSPLDGHHIAAAITHRLMWVGSLVIGFLFFYTQNIIIFIIFIFSLVQLWNWRSFNDNEDSSLTKYQRFTVGWWYFGILSVLSTLTWYIMELLP